MFVWLSWLLMVPVIFWLWWFDYQVTSISIVTFAVIVTKVVGCNGYVKAPEVFLYMFLSCLCHISISTYINIQGNLLKQ